MPFVSFIVGFRDREIERIDLFLASLEKQNDKDFEVVFVDYGSTAKSAEKVKTIVSKHSFARYIYFDARGLNWNRSHCLNRAVNEATGQFLFTCDIDFIFDITFVAQLKKKADPSASFYFKVAYLDQNTKANSPPSEFKVIAYSDENAIGALYIAKEEFEKLHGFDEFFEIWGLEDNDLLQRLKHSLLSVTFYQEKTLIWHVWHLPVKQTDLLPEGWLKLMSDYLRNKTETNAINRPSPIDATRPIFSNNLKRVKYGAINYSKYYLPVFLREELQKLSTDTVLELEFDFSQHFSFSGSRVNTIARRINKVAQKKAWPIQFVNPNMEAYLSPRAALDAVRYFIKLNPGLVRDYFLPNDITRESVQLMRK